jgi:hypothetical protein
MSQNGKLPPSELAPIAKGQLAIAAAASWNAMNQEARRRGVELLPTGSKSSYRTYEQQVELWNVYQAGGNLAAVPGTSNHGWGLAVDAANQKMWDMIAQIGAPFGWQKQWSDAPSEPWHHSYRAGIYHGPDPGPYGQGSPAKPVQEPIPQLPEGTMAIAVGTMTDGRLEVFVETKDGEVFHAYQAKEGGWAGAEAGKRNAKWYSLGTPGK